MVDDKNRVHGFLCCQVCKNPLLHIAANLAVFICKIPFLRYVCVCSHSMKTIAADVIFLLNKNTLFTQLMLQRIISYENIAGQVFFDPRRYSISQTEKDCHTAESSGLFCSFSLTHWLTYAFMVRSTSDMDKDPPKEKRRGSFAGGDKYVCKFPVFWHWAWSRQ